MLLDYRRALRCALSEKRLWAAGLLAALAFSEAWWVIFGWGPEYLGERWRIALAEPLGEAPALAALVMAALAAFVVIRAMGYVAEMVLVRQVAEGATAEAPDFTHAFSSSRRRYLPFAATLLPWDVMRTALFYLPSLLMALWGRWDPHLDHAILYAVAVLLWFCVLVAAAFLVGVTATLAARFALLRRWGVRESWRGGWDLLRGHAPACLAAWLQALAADIFFVSVAWPLSALVPWAAGLAARPMGSSLLRGLVYSAAYGLLATSLLAGQTLVQCFRSSLWTLTFIRITGGGGDEGA